MIHDPLCWIKNPHPNWTKCACCYQIAKIREDMLAKCIAAVRAVGGGYSVPLGMSVSAFIDAMRHQFIAALHDLEETL